MDQIAWQGDTEGDISYDIIAISDTIIATCMGSIPIHSCGSASTLMCESDQFQLSLFFPLALDAGAIH